MRNEQMDFDYNPGKDTMSEKDGGKKKQDWEGGMLSRLLFEPETTGETIMCVVFSVLMVGGFILYLCVTK